MVRAETNAGYGLAGPVFMFVIGGLHGEGRCHGGVVTAFFVDTSGESPTCADTRTERVGLGRSRTRPNPTAQLSLGGRHRTCPRFFSSECPAYGASRSWVGVTRGAAERAPQGDSDSQGRAEVHSLGFFLGLDRRMPTGHSLPIATGISGADESNFLPVVLKDPPCC